MIWTSVNIEPHGAGTAMTALRINGRLPCQGPHRRQQSSLAGDDIRHRTPSTRRRSTACGCSSLCAKTRLRTTEDSETLHALSGSARSFARMQLRVLESNHAALGLGKRFSPSLGPLSLKQRRQGCAFRPGLLRLYRRTFCTPAYSRHLGTRDETALAG
jgi:hypothetical protein